MDIKYNVYVSTSPDGPWVLDNPTPIDHDQTGNEYTITDVIRGALYYIMVVGGYIDDGEFVPLMYQHIGPNPEGAQGVGTAPSVPMAVRNYVVRRKADSMLGHKFEVLIVI